MSLKLYDFELSGNCHKARMLLRMLGLDYERVEVNLGERAQMHPAFVALNPLHKVPVLVDEGVVIRDSAAILVYLSRRYGQPEWYPDTPLPMAEIQQWLSFSVNEVFNGLAICRAIRLFGRDDDPVRARALALDALSIIEGRLQSHDWLALEQFTIADLACYPYTALAAEGEISLEPFPATRAWCRRVEALPGYLPMPGLPSAE